MLRRYVLTLRQLVVLFQPAARNRSMASSPKIYTHSQ